MPPHAPQAPQQEAGQPHHQPQQHVVGQVRCRRVGIGAQRQRMARRVEQHLVRQRVARHRPQRGAGAGLVVLVDQREAVALGQLGRQQVGQDAVDRIQRAQRAEELVVAHDRHFHQHEAVAALVDQRARVDHALGLARGVEGVEHFGLERLVLVLAQAAGELGGRRQRPAPALGGVEPVDEDDLGVLAQDFLRRGAVGALLQLRGGDVARERGQLVLVAQQRQAHALLRPGRVAVQRVALLLAFGLVQRPQDHAHGHGEEHNGNQRDEHEPAGGDQVAPAQPPQAARRRHRDAVVRSQRLDRPQAGRRGRRMRDMRGLAAGGLGCTRRIGGKHGGTQAAEKTVEAVEKRHGRD